MSSYCSLCGVGVESSLVDHVESVHVGPPSLQLEFRWKCGECEFKVKRDSLELMGNHCVSLRHDPDKMIQTVLNMDKLVQEEEERIKRMVHTFVKIKQANSQERGVSSHSGFVHPKSEFSRKPGREITLQDLDSPSSNPGGSVAEISSDSEPVAIPIMSGDEAARGREVSPNRNNCSSSSSAQIRPAVDIVKTEPLTMFEMGDFTAGFSSESPSPTLGQQPGGSTVHPSQHSSGTGAAHGFRHFAGARKRRRGIRQMSDISGSSGGLGMMPDWTHRRQAPEENKLMCQLCKDFIVIYTQLGKCKMTNAYEHILRLHIPEAKHQYRCSLCDYTAALRSKVNRHNKGCHSSLAMVEGELGENFKERIRELTKIAFPSVATEVNLSNNITL